MASRLLRIACWLLATAAVAVALQALARYQLRAQLRHEAVAFLSPLLRGDTPYRWPLDTPTALIGRRVHGDCTAEIDADGLLLRQGSPNCEVALRLPAPLDLRRFARLRIEAAGPLPSFQVQLREHLDEPQHLAAVDSAANGLVRLDRLDWRLDTTETTTPPRRAAMLRLRWGELTADLRLRGVTLLPEDRAPWRAATISPWLQTDLALPLRADTAPLFGVDAALRPETVLQRRDSVREHEPAAVIVAIPDSAAVAAALRAATDTSPPRRDHLGLAVLLIVTPLMALSWRRPRARDVRAVAQAALAVTLPLWLVVGLRLGDDPDRLAKIAIGLTALHVAALAHSDTARSWRWLGGLRAWVYAAVAPLLSLLIVLALGQPGARAAIAPAAVAGYLLWALLQQYLIGAVVADRLCLAGLSRHWVVLVAATLFALLHAPNATLMLATFAGGLIWSATWLQQRSLLPQAVSHVAAAVLLTTGLPPEWLRSAEVSLRYFL